MGRSLQVARKTKPTFVDNSSSNAPTKLAGLHSGPRTQDILGNVVWKAQLREAGTTVVQKWIRSITLTAIQTPILYKNSMEERTSILQTFETKVSKIQSELLRLSLSLRLSFWQLNFRVISAIKRTSELIFTVCLDSPSNIFYNPRLGLIHLW